jgi:carbon-monoxide dehydrogenase small subunit
VRLDGVSVRGCCLLAVQVDGSTVETVESLSGDAVLSPLQEAFKRHHALQCGFCTPGMLMTLTAYLREHSSPTESDIREILSGNLCRCTGYQNIVQAGLDAAAGLRAAGAPR